MNPSRRRVAGVVLAAGSGTRMGGPKAELVVDGERLLDRAIATLRQGGCDPVIAVVRAGTEVRDAVAVVNPHPETGMRGSLLLSTASASSLDVDALAVTLVDLPGIGADAVSAVVGAWTPGRIALARIGTRRVHPTVMSPRQWQDALALAGDDEGARAYLRAHGDLVDEIEVAGAADDLDTPDELAFWRSRGDQRGL